MAHWPCRTWTNLKRGWAASFARGSGNERRERSASVEQGLRRSVSHVHSETDAPPQASTDVLERDTRPKWTQLLDDLDIRTESIVGHVLDDTTSAQADAELCHLYLDCLHYLRDRYSVSVVSLVCSVPEDLQKASLWTLPICFSTLANFLADIMPLPSTENSSEVDFRHMAEIVLAFVPPAPHALAYIVPALSSTHSVEPSDHCSASHIACTLLASPMEAYQPTELDLYHGLFLDCLNYHWKSLCLQRGRRVASPMPYSRASLQELIRPAQVSFNSFTVGERYLTGDDADGGVPSSAWTIGLPIDVPWLGARHDGYPFCSSLSSYAAIRRPKGNVYTLHDDAALWLGSMTFGLLEAITQMRIPERILLVSGTNKEETVLSGSCILQVLVFWIARKHREHGDRQADLEHGREVARLLRRTLRALDDEHREETSILSCAGIPKDKSTDIRCAIAHLIVILWELMRDDELTGWTSLPEIAFPIDSYWSTHMDGLVLGALGRWWHKMLVDAGWCPYTLSALPPNSNALALVVPHLVRLSPYIRTGPGEHDSCREDACVLHIITDSDTYKHRHSRPSCECGNVKPPTEDVLQLLSDDVIPAVIYDGTTLRVIPAKENSYVAISHVWSEGMGSTTDVGLPACLVDHISNLVRRLLPEHDGAFWMDSLCVPSAREQRKKAIKLMADTYRNAAKVLVIDDSIRTLCDSKNGSWPEILLRVATSVWVRRVWTLQEGILARQLYFEFVDGVFSIDWAHLKNCRPVAFLAAVLTFRGNRQGPRALAQSETPLSMVVWLLRGRTTTKAEDELIAISSLLGPKVKIEALLAESDGPDVVERRMRAFLLQAREISLGVPFGTSPGSLSTGLRGLRGCWSTRHMACGMSVKAREPVRKTALSGGTPSRSWTGQAPYHRIRTLLILLPPSPLRTHKGERSWYHIAELGASIHSPPPQDARQVLSMRCSSPIRTEIPSPVRRRAWSALPFAASLRLVVARRMGPRASVLSLCNMWRVAISAVSYRSWRKHGSETSVRLRNWATCARCGLDLRRTGGGVHCTR
ncbi:hypothetical protein C8Q70DRAFT_126211 [Cubamyces menziesii]|nr:hypothetical protein C8Q70DRAFT_126211 [Cubamyces menziesii]